MKSLSSDPLSATCVPHPQALASEHDTATNVAVQRLTQAKLRITDARILILTLLLKTPTRGYTSDSLARLVLEQGVRIRLCTIGQTIRGLTAHGLLTREWTHAGKSIYWIGSGDRTGHSHQMVCRHCERSYFVNAPTLREQLEHLGDTCGMAVATQPISIHVTCAECNDKPQTSPLEDLEEIAPKRRSNLVPLRPARGQFRFL